ncbi:MAG: methionine--tRNA ligase [Candidatus Lightella neohaematopini]|nr:methionine--tRNA ligase [Candidatus Lightella neohaematopini]
MYKKILVTCALPYANGPIHLGHMYEHIQADIWVRYQKLIGNTVYFICADDAHGTPIVLHSKKLGLSIDHMIHQIYLEHINDLYKFNINYDNYYSTHSIENKELLISIYTKLKQKKLIYSDVIAQLYDVKHNLFLPDRFIIGTCPKCFSSKQYGDFCEICSTTYNALELINPKSVLSNTTPEVRMSKHLFFDLPIFNNILYKWINSGVLDYCLINKVKEWFNVGLKPWNISRDAPYFGFLIPKEVNKYFYVWLDASIAYISTFKNFCQKNRNVNFYEFWCEHSNTYLYHFIGKDIVYFHSLFWPAILHSINFRKPSKLFVHGHVNINGEKLSKSKNNFITANSYLSVLDADYLRYYYASKLTLGISDINFNLEEFVQKINNDVINKIINLAARSARFIIDKFSGYLSKKIFDQTLNNIFINSSNDIQIAFEQLNISLVIRKVIYLADLANIFIHNNKPWLLTKKNNYHDLQGICSMGIHLFAIIMAYLKPILPALVERTELFLNTKLVWVNHVNYSKLITSRINSFTHLAKRIELTQVKLIMI